MSIRNLAWTLLAALALWNTGCFHTCGCGGSSLRAPCPPGGAAMPPPPPPPSAFGSVSGFPAGPVR